jgi:tetratricopeptide (TPR) repeat protein
MTDDAEQLRNALFSAVTSGDRERMASLCESGRAVILENFADWRSVPEEIRADEKAGLAYVEGLIQVARWFSEQLKDETLMQSFLEGPEDNPITQWQLKLAQVEDLWEEHDYAGATKLLESTIAEHEARHGAGQDSFLAMSLGRLGESLFQLGRPADAIAPTQRALEMALESDDDKEVLASLGSLYELHRYLGNGAEAASHAEQIAERLDGGDQAEEASLARSKAKTAREGEPLLRVVALIADREVEIDDVESVPQGSMQFAFVRNRIMLESANGELERGRELGAEGDLEGALAAFDRACELDGYAPDPVYERAFTLAQLERYAEAIASYDRVEELAPGWFNSRSDRWLVAELAASRLEHPVLLACMTLEDGPQSSQDKAQLAEAMLGSGLDFPLLRLLLGNCLFQLGKHDEAREQYAKALEGDPEAHVKTRLHTRLGLPTGSFPGDRGHLEEAIATNGSLIAAAQAKIALQLMNNAG